MYVIAGFFEGSKLTGNTPASTEPIAVSGPTNFRIRESWIVGNVSGLRTGPTIIEPRCRRF
jgi:hypothetical protein